MRPTVFKLETLSINFGYTINMRPIVLELETLSINFGYTY